METKILAFSDNHGILPTIRNNVDLVLIAGDIVPLQYQTSDYLSEIWLFDDFIKWGEKINAKKIVFIGGNHDFYLENIKLNGKLDFFKDQIKKLSNDKMEYLCEELFVYNDITIYGTPYCHKFGGWAFMPSDEKLKVLFEEAEKKLKDTKIDILLSHDAPYGTSDQLLEHTVWNPTVPGSHIGSPALRDFILNIQPLYNFHGHLHSTNHEEELLGSTKVYNVSLVNEQYNNVFKPLILTIKK